MPAEESKFRLNKRFLAVGASLLIVVVIVGGVIWYQNYAPNTAKSIKEIGLTNQYLQKNDQTQALAHAKKALTFNPNDVDTIVLVASLETKSNPSDSKKLYARALKVYKQKNNPDAAGKSPIVYWGAAGLAEKAGLSADAKRYYQKVIDTANIKDGYQRAIAGQAHLALVRIK